MAGYHDFSEFYDSFIDSVDYIARAAYFHNQMKPYIGEQKLLLDLACGTGSLSIALARLGYEVIGVDGSEQMLAIAQQKAFDAGEHILFLQQSMQRLDLYGTINACVCALDSLNHLENLSQLEAAIGRVSLFLEAGGVFVFDMNTPYKHTHILADNCFVYEKDQVLCTWRNCTEELETQICLDFFVKSKNGSYKRYSDEFVERAFLLEDILAILTKNKLQLKALYAEDTVDPPTETTQRWVFVAEKENVN